MANNNKYKDLKILEKTLKEFKQAKRLRELNMDKDLTMSEFLEIILEKEFKLYDGRTIKKVEWYMSHLLDSKKHLNR